MKKCLIAVLLMVMPFTATFAASGKNLLNPAHFVLTGHTLMSDQAIPVESSETYMLSFPDFYMLDEMHILVTGESGTTYVDEAMLENVACTPDEYWTNCPITTDASETGLMFTFEGGFVANFYTSYQMFDFQLELGSTRTAYEPYESSNDDTHPLVQGAGLVEVNYAKNKSLATLIDESVTVTDNIDGDLTDSIVVLEDGYTGNAQIPGEYIVLISATDEAGNETQFELVILVIDEVPPVIQGPNTLSVQVDHLIPIDTLITDHFSFTDALDGDCESYEIVSDDYSQKTTVGEYPVVVRTQDKAGNVREKSFTVSIESNLPAVIEGPDNVTLYLSDQPNDPAITQLFSAKDRATLDDLTIHISATEIVDYTQSGRFNVTLTANDSFDNTAEKTITVVLEDDIPPIFTYDDQIVVPLGSTMSDMDLFHVIKSYYLDQGIIVDQLSVIQDDYSEHAHEEGEYAYHAEIVSNTGETFVHNGRIAVIESELPDRFFPTPLMMIGGALTLSFAALLIFKRKA